MKPHWGYHSRAGALYPVGSNSGMAGSGHAAQLGPCPAYCSDDSIPEHRVFPCRTGSAPGAPEVVSGTPVVGRVVPPGYAVHLVKTQGAVYPFPKVSVLHGNHLSEALPLPAIAPPFLKSAAYPLTDVGGCGHDGHARRPIQGFKAPHNGEKFEPIAVDPGLNLVGHEPLRAAPQTEHEAPPVGFCPDAGFRKQKIVRRTGIWPPDAVRHGENVRNVAALGCENHFGPTAMRPLGRRAVQESMRPTAGLPARFTYRQHLTRLSRLSDARGGAGKDSYPVAWRSRL